jgi:uncharacterized membrane protein YeaQ/YmgE (transglycosylase-associated protein family)
MELIAYLFWLAVSGLIVGALARLLVPGRQKIGLLATALLGIAGSFVGGLIFWEVADKPGKHPTVGFLVAVACAALFVYLYSGRR